MKVDAVPDVQVTTIGRMSQQEEGYAVSKVSRAMQTAGAPVLNAQLVIHTHQQHHGQAPVHLEATLDVNGRPVRAHTSASTLTEGADLLEDRLKRQLTRRTERLRARRREPGPQPERSRLAPPEELEVVRRKTFGMPAITSDEAAIEMDLLAHDFYVYLDAASGEHAMVRSEQGPDNGEIHYSVTGTGPELTEAQACERLILSGERVLFYLDATTAGPRVVYVRRDGRLGGISPG